MVTVGLVVEGRVDRVAAGCVLATQGLVVDPSRVIITGGKTRFDTRLPKYNQAAVHGAWLALRDSDHDSGGCPVALRASLLTTPQSPALCLRLAVRTIEAWLLADVEAFADHFSVASSQLSLEPELLSRPKDALVQACRKSKRRDVRAGMAPPAGTSGTGPEYTAFLSRYCLEAWRPEVAAKMAPSLQRTLNEVDRLVAQGTW